MALKRRREGRACQAITVRHDLDTLSLFFQWAEQANYGRSNLVKNVKKPPEGDTERMHILTVPEERRYFQFLEQHGVTENRNLYDLGRLMITRDSVRMKRCLSKNLRSILITVCYG